MSWIQSLKMRIGRSVLGGDPRSIPMRGYRRSIPWRELGDRAVFLDYAFKALSYNGIGGDYAEFGCAGANTFTFAHDAIDRHKHARHMWAFDSFEGLPEGTAPADRHPKWHRGDMAISQDRFRALCKKRGLGDDEYSIVPGYYAESLSRPMPAHFPASLAMAYIDCDLQSSTTQVLDFLWPRLQPGMILAFDDFFCWTNQGISGEQRAFESRLPDEQWRFDNFIRYGWHGQSFVVFPNE